MNEALKNTEAVTAQAALLRLQAEAATRKLATPSSADLAAIPPVEIHRVLYELQVHQIELEMQNEELRRVQEELDAARVRYFDLYDLAPVGYFTMSEQGMILEANFTVCTLLGVVRGELIRQPLSRFIFKEDQECYFLHRKQLFETAEPLACELRMVKTDGTPIWTRLAGTVAHDPDGTPVCRIALSDITASKLQEDALRTSEAKFHDLTENIQIGIVAHAPDSSVLLSNRMAAEILGLTPDQMRGKTAIDPSWCFIREDGTTLPLAEYPINRALAGELSTSGYVVGVIRRDRQSPTWVECYARTIWSAAGKLDQVIIIFSDVTERRKAEAALRESAQMIEGIINAIPVRVFWKDKQLVYMGCNTNFARDAGFTEPKDLIGKDDFQMGWREQAELYRADDQAVIDTGCAKLLTEEAQTTPTGDTLTLLTSKLPLRDSQGEISGVIGTYMDITAHKRAAENLLKIEAQFRTLAEAAPVGIYLCDSDGNCQYTNPAWCAMAGLSPAEALGKGWLVGLHPEDRDRVFAGWNEMVESRGKWKLEYRFQNPEGKVTWVYGLATPQYDPSGNIVQYVGVNLDITERKRIEEVQTFLARTGSGPGDEPFFNALARYLAQSLGMDFVCIDRLEGDGLTAQTVAVWCDGHFEDNVAYALKDTPCGVVVGKQVCCFPASVCEFFPRDEVLKDLRAESYVGVTLFGHTAQPVGLIAVIGRAPLENRRLAEALLKLVSARAASEIERLDAENALLESEAKHRAIICASPVPMALNDEHQRITFLNPAFTQTFGYALEDIPTVAQWFSKAYPNPEDQLQMADAWQARLEQAKRSGEAIPPMEIRVTCKDGTVRSVMASAAPIHDNFAGNHLVVLYDITERKRTEIELQKMEKLQSVGTLAGGIAHDFNNLLLALFGNISIAMDDLSKEHPSYAPLEEAAKSMSRAVRLTKQLLTFAKGGAPVKENLSLRDMVEEVARFDLSGSNVSLVYHAAADLWLVDADKGQLQQVISNLVINARQAMPSGGHLTVTLENADLPADTIPGLSKGKYVKVTVRDEGGGIEPKVLAQIFDPYFTTKQTGSGLGLATVWSIITRHAGHIGVDSKLGQGTTFTFHLPASTSQRKTQDTPPAAECPPPAGTAKILVMDDEEMICDLTARLLTRCGYTVVAAPNGQETIALYRQALETGAPYDAVIMDLTIPGGPGGKEVIQDLLALDPHVRAIVSSGYADDPVMADPAAYGFQGTAAKPYTAGTLREAVVRVLKHRP